MRNLKKLTTGMMVALLCLAGQASGVERRSDGAEQASVAAKAAEPGKAGKARPEARPEIQGGGKDAARPEAAAAGSVNVNEASLEQLTLLPGVGPSRAQQIIDYRRQHPFKRPEELTRIRGIGRKTFVKLRPYLALSGPTTLAERPALARRAPTK